MTLRQVVRSKLLIQDIFSNYYEAVFSCSYFDLHEPHCKLILFINFFKMLSLYSRMIVTPLPFNCDINLMTESRIQIYPT